jgi:hypothetical protein
VGRRGNAQDARPGEYCRASWQWRAMVAVAGLALVVACHAASSKHDQQEEPSVQSQRLLGHPLAPQSWETREYVGPRGLGRPRFRASTPNELLKYARRSPNFREALRPDQGIPHAVGRRAHPVRPVRGLARAEQSRGGQGGIRRPVQTGRGRAQGRGALCLWSIHLGDRSSRGRRRMLYVYTGEAWPDSE